MAYMSQERKAELAPAIKAVLTKYGMKGSISVRHHSSLVVTVKSGPLDIMGNWYDVNHTKRDYDIKELPTYLDVNQYHIDSNYSGEVRDFLNELKQAMMHGNHDNSDSYTDYYDVGWYIDIHIGSWDKPYECTGTVLTVEARAAIKHAKADKQTARRAEVDKELAALGYVYDNSTGVNLFFDYETGEVEIAAGYQGRIKVDIFQADAAQQIFAFYNELVAQVAQEQAVQKAEIARLNRPITPISVSHARRLVEVVYPSCNKNNDLSDNDSEILRKSDTVTNQIRKSIVLSAEDYALVAESLLTDRDYLYEKIGGSIVEAEHEWRLEGLKQFSREWADVFHAYGIHPAVEIIHQQTNERFFVNTEGHQYARYVGRAASFVNKLKGADAQTANDPELEQTWQELTPEEQARLKTLHFAACVETASIILKCQLHANRDSCGF